MVSSYCKPVPTAQPRTFQVLRWLLNTQGITKAHTRHLGANQSGQGVDRHQLAHAARLDPHGQPLQRLSSSLQLRHVLYSE